MTEKQRVKYIQNWNKLLAKKEGYEASILFAGVDTYLKSELSKAIEAAAIFVEGSAKKKSPVDLGLLRASISHRTILKANIVNGEIGTNVEYAPFQEFGTSKMKAQPFLTPALNENKATIQKIINNTLKEALK